MLSWAVAWMASLTYVRGCGTRRGRVGHRCADRRYDVKGCRIACTRGTGMRSARAPAAICIDPPHGTPPNIHAV
eukprot:145818-Prymnesium_polylepis.1